MISLNIIISDHLLPYFNKGILFVLVMSGQTMASAIFHGDGYRGDMK